ncbi:MULTISPECIES: universal stress protein [unclassified Cryobacterium]|uniref:universal stress protein n=1 Tax=unclassified Cryobacterium TaxID=2649013 RepID=UPI002AB5321A|nr:MULTISPECIES: universal stress protein [unclassified Cryobacterium]MDY7542272.1 universal stress protein [Cryobacterium sp. 5B3]MEB0000824.1 universal stress protein [Cryobacterium sp. RTS3]MEB0267520.1 universal stress protein [Cryobacterium sp. 10I5]MEB0276436.1 universal stress protein [Cryobacterium sp. 5B3]
MTRTANYVVAYEATDRGNDAIELGVTLARLTGAELRVCLVLPHSTVAPSRLRSSGSDFEALLEQQGLEWLAEAAARVPADVVATTHLIWADAVSDGLLRAVSEFDSDRIVVGASRHGIRGRYTIGSVANALLHASPVPVALAPHGYQAPERLSRITCAIGTRPGWSTLLDSLLAFTQDFRVDVRFLTLVEVDARRTQHGETTPALEAARSAESTAHLESVLEYFTSRSPAPGTITTEVAVGENVESAVEAIEWRADEVAFVGSSRLAQPSTIFLGITAHRMLSALPVPLVVVPTGASARLAR